MYVISININACAFAKAINYVKLEVQYSQFIFAVQNSSLGLTKFSALCQSTLK